MKRGFLAAAVVVLLVLGYNVLVGEEGGDNPASVDIFGTDITLPHIEGYKLIPVPGGERPGLFPTQRIVYLYVPNASVDTAKGGDISEADLGKAGVMFVSKDLQYTRDISDEEFAQMSRIIGAMRDNGDLPQMHGAAPDALQTTRRCLYATTVGEDNGAISSAMCRVRDRLLYLQHIELLDADSADLRLAQMKLKAGAIVDRVLAANRD